MSAPPQILELAARFERQLDAYTAGQYNETQLRREFLDPLFKALGWDMDNEQGYAEAYKDVIHEDAIRVGGVTKGDVPPRVDHRRDGFIGVIMIRQPPAGRQRGLFVQRNQEEHG